MFACMETPLKIYALLSSVSCTQLIESWVENKLLAYVKISNSHSSIPSPFNILIPPNWLTAKPHYSLIELTVKI